MLCGKASCQHDNIPCLHTLGMWFLAPFLSWGFNSWNHLLPITSPRITCRLCLLLLLVFVRCGMCLVEQPSSTIMVHFPYLVWLSRTINLFWPWLMTRLWNTQHSVTMLCVWLRTVKFKSYADLIVSPWTESHGKLRAPKYEANRGVRIMVGSPRYDILCSRSKHAHASSEIVINPFNHGSNSSKPSRAMGLLCWLSTWSYRLKKKITKAVRRRIQKNKATTRKYIDGNGRTRVCRTQGASRSIHHDQNHKEYNDVTFDIWHSNGNYDVWDLCFLVSPIPAALHWGLVIHFNFVHPKSTHVSMGRPFAPCTLSGKCLDSKHFESIMSCIFIWKWHPHCMQHLLPQPCLSLSSSSFFEAQQDNLKNIRNSIYPAGGGLVDPLIRRVAKAWPGVWACL